MATNKIYYFDLYGKRQDKYNFLLENDLHTVGWQELTPAAPDYFFVPKDFSLKEEYEKGFSITELFMKNGVGICSKRDETAFQFDKRHIETVVNDFKNLTVEQLKQKYSTEATESRDKQTAFAKNNVSHFGIKEDFFQKISYRPFDTRWTYFTDKSKGFLAYPVYDLMQHFTKGENLGLIVAKTHRQLSDKYFFVTETITDLHILDSAADATYIFPLYLYKDNFGKVEKVLNMNAAIVAVFVSHGFTSSEAVTRDDEVNGHEALPLAIFDYVYAVLHSPAYRERYREFLKIDFPRIPYPADADRFRALSAIGARLRRLHLIESDDAELLRTLPAAPNLANYPVVGSNIVEKIDCTAATAASEATAHPRCRVYINDVQYFDNVPTVAWDFYIGGYQPAQKYLKDRRRRPLDYSEIRHYQRLVATLAATHLLMQQIDELI